MICQWDRVRVCWAQLASAVSNHSVECTVVELYKGSIIVIFDCLWPISCFLFIEKPLSMRTGRAIQQKMVKLKSRQKHLKIRNLRHQKRRKWRQKLRPATHEQSMLSFSFISVVELNELHFRFQHTEFQKCQYSSFFHSAKHSIQLEKIQLSI